MCRNLTNKQVCTKTHKPKMVCYRALSSFHHLLKQLSPDSNTKGKQFEKITQWFLQNEPEWQAKSLT
ncbi:MAG: hypothetical protein WCK96_09925 [Methylococcales bacterium]